jgi:Ca-activated chloride channel homolog
MRARQCLALLFIPLMTFAGVLAQEPTIKMETHLVGLTFSVRNPQGLLVTALGREDFSVFEDGAPQKISLFSRESNLPLTLGLLVDASESQDKFLRQHLNDIQTFLARTLQPQDQVFVICFGNHLRLVSDLSSDPTSVVDGLEQYAKDTRKFPELDTDNSREGGSAVYDAIFASASDKLGKLSGRRKALILFTDGEENASAHDEIDAISAAQGADTLVYAIRYTQVKHNKLTADNRHGIAALHHIAMQTGGTDFGALHSDLSEVFAQIGNELRSLYSIGYYSTNKLRDNTFRKVVIETSTPGLTVRAKAGYFAR